MSNRPKIKPPKKPDTRDRVAIADAFRGGAWYVKVAPQLVFYGGQHRPSWWARTWQRVLLGWTWEYHK